ncbi:MAG: peptidylprolyl isomerase [Pseudomonadales bacterium]|nr:peptidylprolyl isomerase [Pseudomonadales bacterium]
MSERIRVQQLDTPAALEGKVAPGRRVSLNFALSLESGEDIENNLAAAPVVCVIGDGSLLPGFEAALAGLCAGDAVDVVLPPEQAFGASNDDNVQKIPRYRFPPDLALSEGLLVDFADRQASYSQAGLIRAIDARYVTVDFNHPLAGRSLRFRARIHAVE